MKKQTSVAAWRHDELADDLARHLKVPDRLVWCDMQIGPMHSSRPDVFTLQKSYTRPLPTAYECKISRGDFQRDITSGKWQDYHAFAGAVSFCVPSGLVTDAEIPAGCGFMVRGDETWATLKRPTRQLSNLKVDHLMKLLIDGYGHELGQIELKRSGFSERRALENVSKKFGSEVAQVIRDLEQAKRMVEYYNEQGEKRRAMAQKNEQESHARAQEKSEELWRQLRSVLGLSDNAHEWNIQQAINKLRSGPTGEEVDRLTGAVRRFRDIADEVLKGKHETGRSF